jgi:hypothetical protein
MGAVEYCGIAEGMKMGNKKDYVHLAFTYTATYEIEY